MWVGHSLKVLYNDKGGGSWVVSIDRTYRSSTILPIFYIFFNDPGPLNFKGTQAWDIFEFFFDLNQILICPW